jgi:hypothetical protein
MHIWQNGNEAKKIEYPISNTEYPRSKYHDMNRRGFLKCASLASMASLVPALGEAAPSVVSLMGQRFVTLCIMIRTTPWEVSRDVKLHPRDEYAIHTLEHARSMREAFCRHNPEGRLTWGFTLNALEDERPNFCEIGVVIWSCAGL